MLCHEETSWGGLREVAWHNEGFPRGPYKKQCFIILHFNYLSLFSPFLCCKGKHCRFTCSHFSSLPPSSPVPFPTAHYPSFAPTRIIQERGTNLRLVILEVSTKEIWTRAAKKEYRGVFENGIFFVLQKQVLESENTCFTETFTKFKKWGKI